MPTEQEIERLAYSIWEEEGRPDGKDQEHYFRAKQILEQKEQPPIVPLTTTPSGMRLRAPQPAPEIEAPAKKRGITTRRKKS